MSKGAKSKILLIIFLMGCNPLRHYNKVATDPDVTMTKKKVIAPFVALHFPVETKYVKGDTVIETDTLSLHDTTYINKMDTVTQRITLTKVIHKKTTDTIYMSNEAERFALRELITRQVTEMEAKDKIIKEYKQKIKDAAEQKFWMMVAIIALGLFNLFILYRWITKQW